MMLPSELNVLPPGSRTNPRTVGQISVNRGPRLAVRSGSAAAPLLFAETLRRPMFFLCRPLALMNDEKDPNVVRWSSI